MSETEATMRQILNDEARAIQAIPYTPGYDRAIELILERIHRGHGKIVSSGMGKAGQIAMNISTTLASTGTPAVNLHPGEAQHGDLGVIQPGDILLLVSNSGKTKEVVDLNALAHRMIPDLPMILITGRPDSELAQVADIVLPTGDAPEVCPLGLTPTTSTTLMTVIGDILVVNLMKRIGFTANDFAMRHRGGYLGEKSRGAGSVH